MLKQREETNFVILSIKLLTWHGKLNFFIKTSVNTVITFFTLEWILFDKLNSLINKINTICWWLGIWKHLREIIFKKCFSYFLRLKDNWIISPFPSLPPSPFIFSSILSFEFLASFWHWLLSHTYIHTAIYLYIPKYMNITYFISMALTSVFLEKLSDV